MQDSEIYSTCNTAHSAIAAKLYHFLAHQNALPPLELVRDIVEANESDKDHLGHALNNLFIDRTIVVLLSGVPDSFKEKARVLLIVDKHFNADSSIEDRFVIRFLGLKYTNPYLNDLEWLRAMLSAFDFQALMSGEAKLTTVNIELPFIETQELMILAEDYCGVYDTCNEVNPRMSVSLIVEIGLFRRIASASGENSAALEAYKKTLKIINQYCSNALYLFSIEPELLIIYPTSS